MRYLIGRRGIARELLGSMKIQNLNYRHRVMTIFQSTEANAAFSSKCSTVEGANAQKLVREGCSNVTLNGCHQLEASFELKEDISYGWAEEELCMQNVMPQV